MRANTKMVWTLLAAAGGLVMPGVALAQECGWEGLDATISQSAQELKEMAVYDDGTGPALYVAAPGLTAGTGSTGNVARFDGVTWTSLGDPGPWGVISALATLDLGDGPRLYAAVGDRISTPIYVLDGDAWIEYGVPVPGYARTLAVFDDGAGPALYAGGDFVFRPGGEGVFNVARLDGDQWRGFGSTGTWHGVLGSVYDMAVFDDGDGAALYIAGERIAPDLASPTNTLTRWDGRAFSQVEGPTYTDVYDLLVFDDGDGEALYLGGRMHFPGGVEGVGVARWDGQSIEPLGSEFDDDVRTLAAFDHSEGGDGPTLYAGGEFVEVGGRPIRYLAQWDGLAWRALPHRLDGQVDNLIGFDGDDRPGLYALGSFTFAGDERVDGIARWDGCAPCPADLDGDGVLTIFDFLAFQNLFDAGDPRADFDGDGELTIFDFLAFQNAFGAGCP